MQKSRYFRHDYYARHDPKLARLRMAYGPITDGIFWNFVEMLYEEGGFLYIEEIPLYARMLNAPEDVAAKVIEAMFTMDGQGRLYSKSVLKRLEKMQEKAEKSSLSAQKRWARKMPSQCDGNAFVMRKKDKERKEKNIEDFSEKL